ncbi:MAG TPA: hypothetical protein EYN67_11850 [Flavobacteriales bacterium]|nr:hypothetical protein [Flavobacteriales bacterium]
MARYGPTWSSFPKSKPRQTGARTGATFSGMQDIIRHSNELEATIQTGYTQCFNLVCYNPTNHGTPVALDGSTAKVLTNNFTDLGSRVNNIAIDLTIKQTDTSKNNTVYTGMISTSFNEGQLKASLMTTNYNDFITSTDTGTYLGEMTCKPTESAYDLHEYSLKDIQQHNIKGLLKPAHQLYSGRIISLNQNLPLPRKNKRQQDGSGLFLVIMNDSDPNGSDVEISLKTFFKEIPVNTV